MADAAAARTHEVEKRVLLAVHVRLHEIERLAGGLALEPKLVAARGPENQLALRERLLHRKLVRVRDEDDLLRVGMLDRHGNNPGITRRRCGFARGGHLCTDLL